MFFGADPFFAVLAVMRLCWIRGRLGGGKTLLAVAIMYELIRRGVIEGVVSNIPHGLTIHPWRDELEDLPSDYSRMPGDARPDGQAQLYRLMNGAGVLFDEAWTMLDNRTSMSNNRAYGAFARKLESYWVFPSVIPLDKRVSYLSVERTKRMVFPVLTPAVKLLRAVPLLGSLLGPVAWLGSEMWQYQWRLDMGYMADEGTFWLMYPERFFAMYDTGYIPTTDAGISELWMRTVDQSLAYDVEEGDWYVDEQRAGVNGFGGNLAGLAGEVQREDTSAIKEYQSKVRGLATRLSSSAFGSFGDEEQ